MIDNKILVLGGVGRSGTTILSKLIGSLKNVEFFYEPKTLDLLFALVDKMDEKNWKAIFRRNIYDDLLINSLAGRSINTNRNDDSSIYNYKHQDEVATRLSKSHGQLELEKIARKKVIAFKLLDTILNTRKVQQYVPGLTPLFIIRNPIDTLSSLLQKGWFSDKSLSVKSPDPSSLFTIYEGVRVPNFVKTSDREPWVTFTEYERYGYYYHRILEKMADYRNGENLLINYEDLIGKSEAVLERVLGHFNLDVGTKTKEVLDTIKYQEKNRDYAILRKLPRTMRDSIEDLYSTFSDSSHT